MPPFQGSITALITPFKNGAVDAKTFQRLVEWQIDQGTHGLVPVGTTGELPTLTRLKAYAGHRALHQYARRPRSGDRRHRLEFHLGSDYAQPRAGAQGGRRRRSARGHALLQQADTGRTVPPLQGDQRRGRYPDHHLQHPRRASSTCRSRPWRGCSSCRTSPASRTRPPI